jgi:hypothetical protein
MPIFRRAASSICGCLLLFAGTANAETVVIDAANPGDIIGAGRDLSFDLSGVNGAVVRARIEFDLNYSKARELSFTLVDSGNVALPLIRFDGPSGSASLRGRYRITDEAITTWVQVEAAANNGPLDATYPSRAFQPGPLGQCLNLLGRFLEYDINRTQPVILRIARTAAPQPGSGGISAARLIVETGVPDQITAAGFDEPSSPIARCKRPSADLLGNGQLESLDSPIALVDFGGNDRQWFIRQRTPALDFGPVALSQTGQAIYAGRFGGRSRWNFGFWDPATASLSFTTGAGLNSVSLVGDWLNTDHIPIPGDYDGDGTTDLAMAFIPGNRWLARIRYSSTGATRDYNADPRDFSPEFASGNIGFGQGQDADLDGRDEITVYAQFGGAGGTSMSFVQIVPNPETQSVTLFRTGGFGNFGDRLVLGRWTSAGFSAMRLRNGASGLEWHLFGGASPTLFGLTTDTPLSINIDSDAINDIAVYRRSDRRIYAIRSSDGVAIDFLAGETLGIVTVPIGNLQGVTEPPPF